MIRQSPRYFLVIAVLLLSACAGRESSTPSDGTSAKSPEGIEDESELVSERKDAEQQRAKQQSGFEELVSSNTKFAFDLHKVLPSKTNQIYSPYSISRALAPVEAGAAGQTKVEIDQVLHFGVMEGSLHKKFKRLGLELSRREKRDSSERGFRLKIINTIWSAPDFEYQTGFLKIAENEYLSPPQSLDFGTNPEKARVAINQHINDATADKIPELLPTGTILSTTRMVLTNAVYFNAPWKIPFQQGATKNELFHPTSGPELKVAMMNMTDVFAYMETEDYQIVRIPYAGDQVAAYILLPKKGSFDRVDRSLSHGRLTWMMQQLRRERVQVKLPKFQIRTQLDLKESLKSMGIDDAFDETKADFSLMAASRESIYITDVLHEGFISVDEAGTEAAAATAVVLGTRGRHSAPPKTFHANRPFTFLIIDEPTNTLLFTARVANPAR